MAELYSLVGSTYDLLQDRRLHHITTDKLFLFLSLAQSAAPRAPCAPLSVLSPF